MFDQKYVRVYATAGDLPSTAPLGALACVAGIIYRKQSAVGGWTVLELGQEQIGDSEIVTSKLAQDAVTGSKIDPTNFKQIGPANARNGAGAVAAVGASIGDKVLMAVNLTDLSDATANFESTITVNNQIQQSSATDLSTKKHMFLILHRT